MPVSTRALSTFGDKAFVSAGPGLLNSRMQSMFFPSYIPYGGIDLHFLVPQ